MERPTFVERVDNRGSEFLFPVCELPHCVVGVITVRRDRESHLDEVGGNKG